MNYRHATLLATMDITTSGTKNIDINDSDVITRIGVIIRLRNNGIVPTNHPLAALPKIEIVDGSQVVASMTGYGAQAMSYFGSGKMPKNELNYEDNAHCSCYVPLEFGRYLYDPLFGLDPTKFKNLQLRITHDYSLGGCSPDAAYLRVVADMFDQKSASPVGYMLNKEIFSFTPATGAEEPILLPLDNTIRKIIVMNTNDAEEPNVEFETIKLSEEDGKRVVFEGLTVDLIREMSTKFGRFGEYVSGRVDAGGDWTAYFSPCKDIQAAMLGTAAAAVPFYVWSGGRVRVYTIGAASAINAEISGRCPHGAVPLLFGNQDDPDDWWDVSNVGKVQLSLTPRALAGGAIDTAKTTDVIVQSVQPY